MNSEPAENKTASKKLVSMAQRSPSPRKKHFGGDADGQIQSGSKKKAFTDIIEGADKTRFFRLYRDNLEGMKEAEKLYDSGVIDFDRDGNSYKVYVKDARDLSSIKEALCPRQRNSSPYNAGPRKRM